MHILISTLIQTWTVRGPTTAPGPPAPPPPPAAGAARAGRAPATARRPSGPGGTAGGRRTQSGGRAGVSGRAPVRTGERLGVEIKKKNWREVSLECKKGCHTVVQHYCTKIASSDLSKSNLVLHMASLISVLPGIKGGVRTGNYVGQIYTKIFIINHVPFRLLLVRPGMGDGSRPGLLLQPLQPGGLHGGLPAHEPMQLLHLS